MVMAARMMSAEHVRQEADAAGIDLVQLGRRTVAQRVDPTIAAIIRQDLYCQPARTGDGPDDDRRAA